MDPQNEPRTCPYCDQPREDTFEGRFRFECGTSILKENRKTVRQGRECKLRIDYSKLESVKTHAQSLLTYLRANVGSNDDWPVEIKTDSQESADKVAELLTNLEQAVKATQ
jgi:hypothetical protein